MCGGGGGGLGGIVSSVSNAVNSAVSTVSNTVNRELTNATDSIARSDVGKVAGAANAPITGAIRAGERVVHGDIGGAASSLAGGYVAMSPVVFAANASPTLRDEMQNSDLNKVSFDYLKNASKVANTSQRLAQGDAVTSEDLVDYYNYGKSTAFLSGALYTGAKAYSAFTGGNTAEAALYASGTKAILGGDLKGGLKDSGLPDYLTDYIPDEPGSPHSEPGSSFPSGGATSGGSYAPAAAAISPVLLLGALGLFIFMRKARR